MFKNHKVADLIASRCMQVDVDCRKDLRHGEIANERDYVSALAVRIRDDLRRLNVAAFSQTAKTKMENRNGIDALIIFRFQNEIKIGFYEAKWPRVEQKNYPWDYLEGEDGISHFSSQIHRQHTWNDVIAIWEMFFNESKPGFNSPPYDYFGSSCVWHPNAFRFLNKEGMTFTRWSTSKLKQLLNTDSVSFYTVIYDILTCRKGKIFPVDLKSRTITIVGSAPKDRPGENLMEIPIPRESEGEIDERVENFMIERNIETYLYLDVDQIRVKNISREG